QARTSSSIRGRRSLEEKCLRSRISMGSGGRPAADWCGHKMESSGFKRRRQTQSAATKVTMRVQAIGDDGPWRDLPPARPSSIQDAELDRFQGARLASL